MLHGKNFLLRVEGEAKHHGFYTTRWVRAENEEAAELAAVALIKADATLLETTLNVSGSEPEPMIYLEGISQVDWITYFRKKPGAGYSFYINEDKN